MYIFFHDGKGRCFFFSTARDGTFFVLSTGVPTRLDDHTLLLQGCRYPEARDLRRAKYGCCSNSTIACYNRRFLNLQQRLIRRGTAPCATGSTEAMEAALTGISGMLFVCFLLSVVWLSSLRGIRSCGGRHGLGSRLGLLGLFVFRFLR